MDLYRPVRMFSWQCMSALRLLNPVALAAPTERCSGALCTISKDISFHVLPDIATLASLRSLDLKFKGCVIHPQHSSSVLRVTLQALPHLRDLKLSSRARDLHRLLMNHPSNAAEMMTPNHHASTA